MTSAWRTQGAHAALDLHARARRSRRSGAPATGAPTPRAVVSSTSSVCAATTDQSKRSTARAACGASHPGRLVGLRRAGRARRCHERRHVARGHQPPGHAVLDGVEQAADGAADERSTAGRRLQRGDAERLVPRHGQHDVGRAVERRHRRRAATAPVSTSRSPTPSSAASERSRRASGSASSCSARRAADDDELGARGASARARTASVEALALDQPAHGEEPRPVGARQLGRLGAARGEVGGVDAARHDPHVVGRHAHPGAARAPRRGRWRPRRRPRQRPAARARAAPRGWCRPRPGGGA